MDLLFKYIYPNKTDEMGNQIEVSFEDYRQENGIIYWWASDLMIMLGYDKFSDFTKAIDKAIKTCITLEAKHHENFISALRIRDGVEQHDYKLTRFACYLTAMNANNKKPEVARAQVYFIQIAQQFEIQVRDSDEIERINIRDEIKEGNKSLSAIAHKNGVVRFDLFNNAGYIGMYNMLNVELAKKRNIDPSKLMEYMGRTELAANLFRITLTEERIKSQNLKGQQSLEFAHRTVGKEVRAMVIQNAGKPPEQLPVSRELPEVKKELKAGSKKMLNADKKNKK